MRYITIFFLLIVPCFLFAQTNYVVKGKVVDNANNSIGFATIQNKVTEEGTNADFTGHYIFKTILPATLKVSFVGYKTAVKKITPEIGKDTIKVDFVLEIDSAQLNQVEVAAIHEPELIKESDNLVDFDLTNGRLILLYEHSHGDLIMLFDSVVRKLTTTQVKYHIERLERNEHFDVYYSHRDSIYFLSYTPPSNSIKLSSLSEAYFESFKPVKAYNFPYYYYEKLGAMNAGVDYIFYNPKNKEQEIFYSYYSDKILNENTEKYEDMLALKESGLMYVGMATSIGNYHAGIDDIGHFNNIISTITHIQSQIIIANDSIYVFNFNSDTFHIYDNHNKLKRKLPMLFEHKKFAISKKEILTDDNRNECYFKYDMHGITYLEKIDLNTGKALKAQSIKFPFLEKLRISEGYAYYTFSNGGGEQVFVRYLYKQKLN